MGLRVSADHELIGLDIAEMGMEAYPEGITGAPPRLSSAANVRSLVGVDSSGDQ